MPMSVFRTVVSIGAVAALLAIPLVWPSSGVACPYCSATQATLRQDFENSDVVVIAEQLDLPETEPGTVIPAEDLTDPEFRIVEFLRGQERYRGPRTFRTTYFGLQPPGTKFLIMGLDRQALTAAAYATSADAPAPTGPLKEEDITWNVPTPLTEAAVKYIDGLENLPEDPVEQLDFFQQYFEHPDETLRIDAYNEFALANYDDIKALKPKMNRQKYLGYILDPEVSASHRRQYLALLSICGSDQDVPLLYEMMTSTAESTLARNSLDAIIGCYLSLKGPSALPVVENLFLSNVEAEKGDTYNALAALRFHAEQEKILQRDAIAASLRTVLDRPDLADLVIPDLARLEDWTVRDRLVQMFKDSDPETSWVRVPILRYLMACPQPAARDQLDELRESDPKNARRAMLGIVGLRKSSSATSGSGDSSKDETPAAPGVPAAEEETPQAPVPPPSLPADDPQAGHWRSPFPSRPVMAVAAAEKDLAVRTVPTEGIDRGPIDHLRDNLRKALDWRLAVMVTGVAGLVGYRFWRRRRLSAES